MGMRNDKNQSECKIHYCTVGHSKIRSVRQIYSTIRLSQKFYSQKQMSFFYRLLRIKDHTAMDGEA